MAENDIMEVEVQKEKCAPCPQISCDCCAAKQQDVRFNVCEDVKDVTVSDVLLNCEARFLKVRVNLDRVCAGRKITVGCLVCENVEGTFFLRGVKACEFTVPGPVGNCVNNVNVNEFCFIFPEENLCSARTFRVSIIAQYSSFPSFPFCPV